MRRYSFLCSRRISEEELLGIYSRIIPNLRTEAEMRNHWVERLRYRTKLFSEHLLSKPWQVWVAPTSCEFVTCDSPVMTLRFDEWGRYYVGNGFGRDGVVVMLPLSPRASLFAGLQGYSIRTVPEGDVWEMNKVVVSSASRFVYSKTQDHSLNALVQELAGSIRYGVDAFRGNSPDEVLDLLL